MTCRIPNFKFNSQISIHSGIPTEVPDYDKTIKVISKFNKFFEDQGQIYINSRDD